MFVLEMEKNLSLELLHNYWIIHQDSVELYGQLAYDILSGKTISNGLFSSLELPSMPSNVALIPIVGVMMKSDFCGGQGTRSLTNELRAAAADPQIDAIVVLSENCPGGQVDGTTEFSDMIRQANAKKPVVGAVSGMACSAAYWALSQTAEIYSTSPTDMVGCIGVMGRMKNPKKVNADNQDTIEVVSDLSPDKNSEFKDPEQLKARYINPAAELFQAAVKEGRGSRLKLNREDVLSGKTYIAGQAEKFGMIDGIMSMNKIIARAQFLAKKRKAS